MTRWTRWRKLASAEELFDDLLDNEGPACYELGIKAKGGKRITPVYVGHTCNENRRMTEHGDGISHLEDKFLWSALRKGYVLYYRAQAKRTTRLAARTEKQLLRKIYYPWNLKQS